MSSESWLFSGDVPFGETQSATIQRRTDEIAAETFARAEEKARVRGAQVGALLAARADRRVREIARPAAAARFEAPDSSFHCPQYGAHARADPGRTRGSSISQGCTKCWSAGPARRDEQVSVTCSRTALSAFRNS